MVSLSFLFLAYPLLGSQRSLGFQQTDFGRLIPGRKTALQFSENVDLFRRLKLDRTVSGLYGPGMLGAWQFSALLGILWGFFPSTKLEPRIPKPPVHFRLERCRAGFSAISQQLCRLLSGASNSFWLSCCPSSLPAIFFTGRQACPSPK